MFTLSSQTQSQPMPAQIVSVEDPLCQDDLLRCSSWKHACGVKSIDKICAKTCGKCGGVSSVSQQYPAPAAPAQVAPEPDEKQEPIAPAAAAPVFVDPAQQVLFRKPAYNFFPRPVQQVQLAPVQPVFQPIYQVPAYQAPVQQTSCADKFSSCSAWKSVCNNASIQNLCPSTCGLCGTQVQIQQPIQIQQVAPAPVPAKQAFLTPFEHLHENTKFDELLVENQAEFISQMNFTMVSDNCVDQELFDQCYEICRAIYLQCSTNCDNASCDVECSNQFKECGASCPCGENCPNGCAGCENDICGDKCENAKTENLDFINCREAALENQASCTRNCPPKRNCFEECNAAFLEELDECPCVQEETATTTTMSTSTIASNEPRCDLFDGTSSRSTHSAQFSHNYVDLGYYKGQPTTVGGGNSDGHQKVETYSTSGWTSLPDHPRNMNGHTLTGLESGAMLMVGGYDYTSGDYNKDIWLLKEEVWTLIGSLKENSRLGSALKIGNYIYQVNGNQKDSNGLYPVERIKVANDEIIETQVIGAHEFTSYKPAILEVTADFCV
ncbi:Oidioi.mRNA.OKI2018_I69.PAR.g8447.t1.cds [Oikopleura dioica]|uniref:Oidioi.mRNA.OKI2018_I69.PAR.g8447.t1.cds n=1 Tax=Oikopleura dioica TaxID=34765 RepID=A0ABN7RFX1_OIKDI|nr:Oidioi.mRNA.OKI2018_I69.PAR.g8447.t1.cds [Oikopleura dioica]